MKRLLRHIKPISPIHTQKAPFTNTPHEIMGRVATEASAILDNLPVDSKTAIILTFLGFHVANRLDKNTRMRQLLESQEMITTQMNSMADKARLRRHDITSALDLGPSRTQEIQDEQDKAHELCRSLTHVTRQAQHAAFFPLYYGFSIWNQQRVIERNENISAMRLMTRITLNDMLVRNKTSPLTLEEMEEQFRALTLIPEANTRIFRRICDNIQSYIFNDVRHIGHSLERDILDTRLALLTDNNYLDEALAIVKLDILRPAKNEKNSKVTLNAPTLNRVASLFLRAGANAKTFDTEIGTLLQDLYTASPLFKEMQTPHTPDRDKWYAAATLLCDRSIDITTMDSRWQSGVPYSFLGTVSLRKAYALTRYLEGVDNQPDLAAKRQSLLEEARKSFDQAVDRDPRAVYYLTNRALVLSMLGHEDLATHDINNALAKDPHNAYSHMINASLLLQKGDTKKAVQEASFIINVSDKNHIIKTIVHTIAAQVHAANGNQEKMTQHISYARQHDPLLKDHPFPIKNAVLDRLEQKSPAASGISSFLLKFRNQFRELAGGGKAF